MKENWMFCFFFYLGGLWLLCICATTWAHAVIYIEYQGVFMLGLEILNKQGKKQSVFHIPPSDPQCQWHIFKTTFGADTKPSEMSTLTEDGSESDVNLLLSVLTSLSIVAYSHEQSLQSTGKNVISKGLSRVSCQSRLEINLIFVNGERVMCLEGPWGMMCEYLWLSQW